MQGTDRISYEAYKELPINLTNQTTDYLGEEFDSVFYSNSVLILECSCHSSRGSQPLIKLCVFS